MLDLFDFFGHDQKIFFSKKVDIIFSISDKKLRSSKRLLTIVILGWKKQWFVQRFIVRCWRSAKLSSSETPAEYFTFQTLTLFY